MTPPLKLLNRICIDLKNDPNGSEKNKFPLKNGKIPYLIVVFIIFATSYDECYFVGNFFLYSRLQNIFVPKILETQILSPVIIKIPKIVFKK